jgi:hypothetical protein
MQYHLDCQAETFSLVFFILSPVLGGPSGFISIVIGKNYSNKNVFVSVPGVLTMNNPLLEVLQEAK